MLSLSELEVAVRRAVARYNRFRSPDAIARIVQVSQNNVTISITGAFCASCGVLGYIEGFIAEFKSFTNKAELKIEKTRELTPRRLEVSYKLVQKT